MRIIPFLTIFIIGTLTLMGFQNCSSNHTPGENQQDSSTVDEISAINNKAEDIFTNKCSSCHNSDIESSISDFSREALIASGHIIEGRPQESKLYLLVVDRQQPPASSGIDLTDEEIDIIRSWIVGPQKINYFEDIRPVLQQCNGCHASTKTYSGVMRWVKPGLPEESQIIVRLTTDTEENPYPKAMPVYSQEEISILVQWISEGAIEFPGDEPKFE